MTKPFKNAQWRVTSGGLEAVDGEYSIPASSLTETRDGIAGLYEWPEHMAWKNWVDIEAFIEAFVHALERHVGRYKPAVDHVTLHKSLVHARRERRLHYG
jgi:hypothetical protein